MSLYFRLGGCHSPAVACWASDHWVANSNSIIIIPCVCLAQFSLNYVGWLVCWSLTSLCHSNGHIETMPAREINPFTALTRIRSQFLRTQWSTSNHQRVDTTTPQTAEPSGLASLNYVHKRGPKHHHFILYSKWNDGVLGLFCAHCLG